MPNIYEPVWDEPRDHEGFRARRARLGYQLGSERVGISLWELPPGERAYPYHFHLAEEELLVVLEGAPLLRTPEGERRLERGEVVRFPMGEDGAHQLRNDTGDAVRFLAVSTHGQPDVVLYPDEGKISPAERTPDGSGLKLYFPMADAVDYWDGVHAREAADVDPA
ncbi:MAG TPA: cupin domain-containing protein [Baekduia sp.]|nr:cupin domain-containing protein [Baekduia sp.]